MASTNQSSIGYGAPAKNLIFTGEESNYEVWEMRFVSYLRLQKLHKYVMTDDDQLRSVPVVSRTGDQWTAEKNTDVSAALV